MTERIQHPLIGTVVGKAENGVAQFLGLKYASLTDRLSAPQICSNYSNVEIDATKIGPQVVSPPNGCDTEFRLFQQSLPCPTFHISDLHGLHLNITAPIGAKNLPVLVFIHGGGFAVGSNAWPQYNHARLVNLSVKKGLPIVAVGINYRLGIAGFLTSEDLRAQGYKSNNGIRDQRVALQWVRRYIEGFGGNPNEVTLIGQSAGAVAAILHLQAEDKLFTQLIAMSGTPLALRPVLPIAAEETYSHCLEALGIQNLSPEDQLKEVVHGPMSTLWAYIPPAIQLLPIIDNETVFEGPTYQALHAGPKEIEAILPGIRWCRRILLGDCKSDASIFAPLFASRQPGIASVFYESMARSLRSHPNTVKGLVKEYNITPDSADEVAWRGILEFASDIRFYAPVIALGDNWVGESYIYHFNEPNPWEGPWKGEANHLMDVVYLFQNFNEKLSPAQQKRAEQFAEHIVIFVNGKSPYPSRQSNKNGAMVYGGPTGATFVESATAQGFGRRDTIFTFAKTVGLDALNEALIRFLAGK